MVDRSLQAEILAAAKRARERERSRKRRSRLAKANHRRKPPAAVLDLLGCEPDPAWLASVARSQARIRSAVACMSSALARLTPIRAAVSRHELRLALAAIGDCRRLIEALAPVTVCPHCHATDPACQHCSGLGCLTLAQAARLPHELLHDR